MAMKQRKPSFSLLLHSDRGSQYASDIYQLLLKKIGSAILPDKWY
jgi:transposase InsO family protein